MQKIFFAYLFWMIVLSALTFVFWLRPEGFFANWRPYKQFRQRDFDLYTLISTLLGILFFISCFILGVWVAKVRLKGYL